MSLRYLKKQLESSEFKEAVAVFEDYLQADPSSDQYSTLQQQLLAFRSSYIGKKIATQVYQAKYYGFDALLWHGIDIFAIVVASLN